MAKHQEGEKYLQPEQYYIDLYDLLTINRCLDAIRMYQDVYKKSLKTKKLEHLPKEEKFRSASMLLNQHLYFKTAIRFKNKQKTIQEWVQKDRNKQDKYDNAVEPALYCPDCNTPMESFFKTLDTTLDSAKHKVLFFMKCPECDKREGIYEDGEIRETKSRLCPKCEGELTYSHDKKGKVCKWITKCKSCDYKKGEIDDHDKWKKEHAEKEAKDKELLAKYRAEFCLDEKEGNERVEMMEALEVANVVHAEEIQKYDNQAYADSLKLKKTTIPDLEKIMIQVTNKANYTKLSFEKPEIGQYVIIPFSVQDPDSERTSRDSSQELEEIIKNALKDTNWRLMSGVSYRLGYLQGRLKSYEQEEDMLKIVGKKENKPQSKVDPEKYTKYASNNMVQLARLFGKIEGIEKVRKRRLEKEPDGFFLIASEGPYDCSICKRSHPGNKIWWNQYGQRCIDCWNNIKAGVIPKDLKSAYDNDKQWIADWQMKDDYGVHPATRGKYVREGFLKVRELKDSAGWIYFKVYMQEDNKEFLKKHPKKP